MYSEVGGLREVGGFERLKWRYIWRDSGQVLAIFIYRDEIGGREGRRIEACLRLLVDDGKSYRCSEMG